MAYTSRQSKNWAELIAITDPSSKQGQATGRPQLANRSHRGPDSAAMREIVELLRKEGFSEPCSLEREPAVIEAEATGQDVRRYEIYIDPKTRKILKREEDE